MKYKIGESVSATRVATKEDVKAIAKVTGNYGSVHFDDEIAKAASFEGAVVQGYFLLGMISSLIGMKLPGSGAVLTNQHFKYTNPVYVGDEVTAVVKVEDYDPVKGRMKIDIVCTNQDDTVVLTGKSNVKLTPEE